MKVRATRIGYYNHLRRREGDVFVLKAIEGHAKDPKTGKVTKKTFSAEEQFSPNWMEEVDAKTPTKVTTAKQALREASNDIKSGRLTPSERAQNAAEEAAEI